MIIFAQNIKNKIMTKEQQDKLIESHTRWCELAVQRGEKLKPKTWLEAARTIREIMEQFPKDQWDLIIDELNL